MGGRTSAVRRRDEPTRRFGPTADVREIRRHVADLLTDRTGFLTRLLGILSAEDRYKFAVRVAAETVRVRDAIGNHPVRRDGVLLSAAAEEAVALSETRAARATGRTPAECYADVRRTLRLEMGDVDVVER